MTTRVCLLKPCCSGQWWQRASCKFRCTWCICIFSIHVSQEATATVEEKQGGRNSRGVFGPVFGTPLLSVFEVLARAPVKLHGNNCCISFGWPVSVEPPFISMGSATSEKQTDLVLLFFGIWVVFWSPLTFRLDQHARL